MQLGQPSRGSGRNGVTFGMMRNESSGGSPSAACGLRPRASADKVACSEGTPGVARFTGKNGGQKLIFARLSRKLTAPSSATRATNVLSS